MSVDKELKIVLVGAGNLATQLASAMGDSGLRIAQVYSFSLSNSQLLAGKIGAEATDQLSQVCTDADLYIYAVKDAVLADVIRQIDAPQALHVHTAGSMRMDVFDGIQARYGVFYPLQTFSKERKVDFRCIPFCLEAKDSADLALLKTLASCLSDKVYEVNSEQRSKLHLAAVFTCNFVNRMYAIAHDIARDNDLPFDVLLPLIDETARKVHDLEPLAAQTGPAIRFDENVINKHISMLDDDRLKALYRLVSEDIYEAGNCN